MPLLFYRVFTCRREYQKCQSWRNILVVKLIHYSTKLNIATGENIDLVPAGCARDGRSVLNSGVDRRTHLFGEVGTSIHANQVPGSVPGRALPAPSGAGSG